MTNLPASLAARFATFAAVAVLALSTVLATGCAQGLDADGTDGTVADTSSEQARLNAPKHPKLGEAVVLPKGTVARLDPDNAFGRDRRAPEPTAPTAKVQELGDGVRAPSDDVVVAPHHVPGTVSKPTLREMGGPIEVPSGYVADAPDQLPQTGVQAESQRGLGDDLEIPPAAPELDLDAACDREGRCPTQK